MLLFHRLLVALVGFFHLPEERRRCEHRFDRLERTIFGFRIEDEDDRDPDEVQRREEEVCTILEKIRQFDDLQGKLEGMGLPRWMRRGLG